MLNDKSSLCRAMSPPAAANLDESDFEPRHRFHEKDVSETEGSGQMIQLKRERWDGALQGGFPPEPLFHPTRSAPGSLPRSAPGSVGRPGGRELPLTCDLVALLLTEDARSQRREAWLGLGLAAATVALFASGAGIPLLAIAFCAAPIVGIGLEIFAPGERRRA